VLPAGSERARERLCGFYRWWSGHVVQRPTYLWSFRLVGAAWVLFGLILLVGGLGQLQGT
jgi:hypothetical protein